MNKFFIAILGLTLTGMIMTASNLPNTCSKLGVNAPVNATNCYTDKEGLLEGEKCCFVDAKTKDTKAVEVKACRKLEKNANQTTINTAVTEAGFTDVKVDCASTYITFSFVIALIAAFVF